MAAHRDEFPLCPRCKRPLEALGNGRLVCGDSISCGVLLRDDTLRELLVLGTEIDAATFVLPLHDGKRGVAMSTRSVSTPITRPGLAPCTQRRLCGLIVRHGAFQPSWSWLE